MAHHQSLHWILQYSNYRFSFGGFVYQYSATDSGQGGGLSFMCLAYALLQFVWEIDINFIHLYAVLFVIEVLMMLAIGWKWPSAEVWCFSRPAMVDLTPWRYAHAVAGLLVLFIVLTYVLFSPLGIATSV